MENAVYWNGRQVGIESAGRISWFTSAPQEAIAAYSPQRAEQAKAGDTTVARNLSVSGQYDPLRLPD
jgi:hypothetical protein